MELEECREHQGLRQASVCLRYQGRAAQGDQLAGSHLRLPRCVRPTLTRGASLIADLSASACPVGKRNEVDIPIDASGEMYTRVFGSTATPFERFVVDRKIMGPCWLNIKSPKINKGDAVSLGRARSFNRRQERELTLLSTRSSHGRNSRPRSRTRMSRRSRATTPPLRRTFRV